MTKKLNKKDKDEILLNLIKFTLSLHNETGLNHEKIGEIGLRYGLMEEIEGEVSVSETICDLYWEMK